MLQMDRAECHAEMEAAQRASRQRTQDDRPLAEPSQKANVSLTGSSNYSNPARKDWPPKLTRKEGDLLLNNHGCLKCHKPYVFHTKNDNKCDFPKGSGYKPVTQTVVDIAHREHDTKKKHPVAAIASISSSMSDATPHPVATVMGFTSNPTGYVAANASNVLSDDKEDELHSDVCTCNALIESIEDPEATPPKADESQAPLTVPHLFWHASYSPPDDFPLTFDCLLDVGSHLVIIRKDLVDKLKLRCKRLRKPIFTKTAMHDGQKNVIAFDEFVNLQLYDASGHYISKTVRAVISPSLCTPILLGLPFLKHNNIVIDIEAKTAIDKKNDFNLLNPSLPEKLKFRNSKMKFNYEYHANILKLRKSLLEDLKVTLSRCKNKTCSKHVQWVDVVAAV